MMGNALITLNSSPTGLNFAAVAALMGTVGEMNFADQLLSILRSVADFDGSAAYLLRRQEEGDDAIKLWASGVRTDDMFENANIAICRRALGGGLVTQRDLQRLIPPVSECAALCAQSNLYDDFVSFSIRIADTVKLIVSIWRKRGTGRFGTDSITNFRALEPVVHASAAKHIRLLEAEGVFIDENEPEMVPRAIQSESLTKRERQIVDMVFEGHCSESIGHTLGISYGTVKIHKKNIYRKLKISSESELLRMFMDGRDRSNLTRGSDNIKIISSYA